MKEQAPPARARPLARDFGLASLMISTALFVNAPLAMILAVQIWSHADRTPGVVLLHAWLARIGCPAILALSAGSVWLGCLGVQHAKREQAAAVLPLAGLLFSVVTLLLWIIASIGFLNTTESLLRLYCS